MIRRTLPVAVPHTPTALFELWQVDNPHNQQTAVADIATAWNRRPRPCPECSSQAVLTAEDGDTLLLYTQTTGPAARPEFTCEHGIDITAPGVRRLDVVAARLQRSTPIHGPVDQVGCVVLVTRVFDGPNPARAAAVVDTMFAAGTKTTPAPGMISAHFYVGLDGRHVLNYALWTSADAHQAAIDHTPAPLADSDEWRKAHTWPGLLSTGFRRYRPRLHFATEPGGEPAEQA